MLTRRQKSVLAAHQRVSDNYKCPACSLPVELVVLVFEQLFMELLGRPNDPWQDGNVCPWLPLFAHVCSQWRRVSLAAPSLWRAIPITPSSHCQERTKFMLHRSRSSQSIDLVIYDFPSRTSSTKANWCSWIAPHSSRVRSLSLYRSSLDIPNPRLLETLASCTWPRLTVLQFEAYPLEKPPTTPVDFLLQAVIGTGSPDLKALTIPYLPKTCSLGADLSTLKITSPFENTGELSCVLGSLTRLGRLDIHCDFDIITLPSTIILSATLHTFHASGPDVACATLFQLLRVEESPGPDVFRKLAIYMERTYDLEIMDELVTGLTKFLGVFVPGDEAFTTITYSLVKTAEPNMQALSVRGLGKMAFVALTGYDWAHADEFDFGIDFLSCLTGRRHLGFEFEVDADFTPKHFANSHFRACACFPSKVHWFQLEAPLETFCLSSALWALPQPNPSLLFLG